MRYILKETNMVDMTVEYIGWLLRCKTKAK